MTTATKETTWMERRIKPEEIDRYTANGVDCIPDGKIEEILSQEASNDRGRIEAILAKSLDSQTLSPDETAVLMKVTDPELVALMEKTAGDVKRKVYDNRIVTFAPLYMSNHCVNNCLYCGLRRDNHGMERRALSLEEVKRETEVLAGQIGHKRLIVVYGEHPAFDVDYMVDTIQAVYSVKSKTRKGTGEIRRVNVNAAPLSIDDLKKLNQAGLGTYQVFQETYHRKTYDRIHPKGTLKNNFDWRLYAPYRAQEAGIDDVGFGALFGLYDWKYEVLGLLYHAIDMENKFGIGPHTVSFPRLEPAANAPYATETPYAVSDADFRRIITVIRLALPYTGMILTARESARVRRDVLPLGVTQTDASTRIGVGSYVKGSGGQEEDQQQFVLGDTRSLDEVIRELATMGHITSFCTAGYRCGRTGKCIMELLRSGAEGKFCKMNAVLTFKEWLDDFASPETRAAGEKVLAMELEQVKEKLPHAFPRLMESYQRIQQGERDLFF